MVYGSALPFAYNFATKISNPQYRNDSIDSVYIDGGVGLIGIGFVIKYLLDNYKTKSTK